MLKNKKSMNKWKWSFFISLVTLLISNTLWLYAVIDSSITYTYQQVTLDEKEKAVKLLGELIVKGGQKYTKKDILHILRQTNKKAFIVEEKNLIDVEGIRFIFRNGKLITVES